MNNLKTTNTVTFDRDDVTHLSITRLLSANICIVYKDNNNSDVGTCVIVTPNNEIVGSETIFNPGRTSFITTTVLLNGNVLIAYADDSRDGSGSFSIVSPSGELVSRTTAFNKGDVYYTSATALYNGNALIAYTDNHSDCEEQGKFVIVDPAGVIVVEETTFNKRHVYSIGTTTLPTGNVLIDYIDGDYGDTGTGVIVTPNGEIVGGEIIFNNGETSHITTAVLPNGNVLIAYADDEHSGHGKFVIMSPIGELVTNPTVFSTRDIYYASATALPDGNVLIAYVHDQGEYDGEGTFVIVDPAGVIVADETVFNESCTGLIVTTTLPNGNAWIEYVGLGNIDPFGSVTVSPTGEIVPDDKPVSEVITDTSRMPCPFPAGKLLQWKSGVPGEFMDNDTTHDVSVVDEFGNRTRIGHFCGSDIAGYIENIVNDYHDGKLVYLEDI